VYDANFINTWQGKVIKKGIGRMNLKENEMMMLVILYGSLGFEYSCRENLNSY
jgi:hypothetical protein